MLALLFYAEGCFIYAEVEIFQVKNKKLISTAGFRGSKLFQKQKHKIQLEKVISYFLRPESISLMFSGKFLLYSDRLLTTLENSVMQFKEPRKLWKAQAQLCFYHLLVVPPWARHFIAIWICFHIWKMAITVPTSQKNCIKEMMYAINRLLETPWTVANQAPLSMGFFRQEYWSGLPFPSPLYCTI